MGDRMAKYRPIDPPFLDSLVGLTAEIAAQVCADAGFTSRCVRIDGDACMITADVKVKRANFTVVDGIVTGATAG